MDVELISNSMWDVHSKVKGFIRHSQWRVLFLFRNLINLNIEELPDINANGRDKVSWTLSPTSNFSLKHSFNALIPPAPLFTWNNILWFSKHIPKHAFVSWLTLHNRLYTKDRSFTGHRGVSTLCNLCMNEDETHEHLFFKCSFSSYIWDHVQHTCGLYCGERNHTFIAKWIDNVWNGNCNSMDAITVRLCFSAAIYFIWKERNKRTCAGIMSSPHAMWKLIEDCIRSRLLSMRFKNSKDLGVWPRIGDY
ncbi:uncharacterized protein LOC132282220 [Cornus florida]|uniref:uncharacterized protein LOC132282220 n=1 Tax=Cornus florida TaxID=4283 RepID=UPI0028A222F4|nr:uncharacterized protein LOC132282220 [Cornus florida]